MVKWLKLGLYGREIWEEPGPGIFNARKPGVPGLGPEPDKNGGKNLKNFKTNFLFKIPKNKTHTRFCTTLVKINDKSAENLHHPSQYKWLMNLSDLHKTVNIKNERVAVDVWK